MAGADTTETTAGTGEPGSGTGPAEVSGPGNGTGRAEERRPGPGRAEGSRPGPGAADGTGPATGTGPADRRDGPRPLVVSDLDRTLIYSSPNALMLPEHGAPDLCCVEHYRGKRLSFVTVRAAKLLARLDRLALFVPATTRTREQYARVELPVRRPRYAITTNGGHLLVDGVSDPAWERRVRERLRDCAPLVEVQSELLRQADRSWLLNHRVAEELFCYLVVDRAVLPPDWLRETAEWARGRGWTASLQGRKVYLLPEPLTKSAAMREVRRREGPDAGVCLAAGDSLLDAELLRSADVGFRPAHGELADAGWTAPGVLEVPERGVRAGEEILRRLLGAVRGGLGPSSRGGPGQSRAGRSRTGPPGDAGADAARDAARGTAPARRGVRLRKPQRAGAPRTVDDPRAPGEAEADCAPRTPGAAPACGDPGTFRADPGTA